MVPKQTPVRYTSKSNRPAGLQPHGRKIAQHTRVALSVLTALVLPLAASCSNSPAPQPTPLATATVTVEATATTTPAPTQTATPAPAPTATPRPSLVCSPLAVQPLETIAEIITQPFIMPRVLDNGQYKDDAHHGVDLGYYTRNGELFTGTPVLSALEGKVAAVIANRPPYGDAVIIETPFERLPPALITQQNIAPGSSLYTLYAHLQNLQPLAIGQPVECGQPLAQTGLTGFTGGPHLHFETRWGPPETVFNGMAYYKADTTEEERANYETWRMSGTFHLFDALLLLTLQP